MTRFFEHAIALVAAVIIMTATFIPVVTVPQANVFAAAPVMA